MLGARVRLRFSAGARACSQPDREQSRSRRRGAYSFSESMAIQAESVLKGYGGGARGTGRCGSIMLAGYSVWSGRPRPDLD